MLASLGFLALAVPTADSMTLISGWGFLCPAPGSQWHGDILTGGGLAGSETEEARILTDPRTRSTTDLTGQDYDLERGSMRRSERGEQAK
jgi:hypothetical protein